MPELQIIQVSDPEDDRQHDFVEVYKEAFARAPYFEVYESDQEILEIWHDHVVYGTVFLAVLDGQAVGLITTHDPLDNVDPEIRDHFLEMISECPFDPSFAVFISEHAVHSKAEGRGIGTRLLEQALLWAKNQGLGLFAMCTAHQGSNSEHLYRSVGAEEAVELVQYVENPAGNSQSKQRIYLWGVIDTALQVIKRKQERRAGSSTT